MPPSTLKVRNGSPTTASTTASQTQILVATTSPSLAPSRSELCLPISPPRPGRMHSALVEDLRHAGESLPGCVGDVVPAVGSRPANPVVERLGAWPERLPHDDPADHPHSFVGHAVVVIDTGYGERDFEVVARMHKEPRVPGLGPLRNSQWMIVVARVVGGRRVYVLTHDPAHRRTRFHVEPDRIEPYPGAERVAAHLDHLGSTRRGEPSPEARGSARPPGRHKPAPGQAEPAGFRERAT